MKPKMWIEGDGATDLYDMRIKTQEANFVIKGLTRKEMNYHLKDMVDQFLSLQACFDKMSQE